MAPTTALAPAASKNFQAQDIDAAWLEEVLSRKYEGVKVESVAVDAAVVGMSVKHRLHVRFRDGMSAGLPSTMIAKGRFGRHSEEWDWMFETEMRAYRDFLRTINVPAPHTYFADYEPHKGAALLLLEDLGQAGVRFNDVFTALTYRQAAAFLDIFARFHARYWNSPELDQGGTFAWTLPLLAGWLTEEYFPRVTSSPIWDEYLAMPRGATVPRVFKDGERMRRAFRNLAEFQKTTPWCIVHGDAHFGNSYLYPDGSPGLLDWQIKRGPWHQDFTYFLVSALDVTDRREWERPLIEYYLSRLSGYGVTPPSFSEALLAYRAEILYDLLIWMTNGDDKNQYQKESVNTGNTVRFVVAALDHDSLNVIT